MTFNKIRITIIASEIENAKKPNNIEKRELTNLPLALAGKTNINNESIELTKNPMIVINNRSNNFKSVLVVFNICINLELGNAGIRAKLAIKKPVVIDEKDKIPDIKSV